MDATATLRTGTRARWEPRIEARGRLRLAGLRGQFRGGVTHEGIANLWQRFAPQLSRMSGRHGDEAFGLCLDCTGADTFAYVCAVPVRDFSRVPGDWTRLELPPRTYAVFAHHGHVSTLRRTVQSIFGEWLPRAGRELASIGEAEPDFFECYGREFDPSTGVGGIEIWLPIRP
jgi:AraC family transcriptional regulator